MNKVIKHLIKGTITWSVEKDGQIIRQSNPYSNLILNQGLDFIASYAFADCFNYCAVGSGTVAPNKTDTGLSNEIKRTNNLNLSSGQNGTTLSNNVFTVFRTFVFVTDIVPHTYSEVGFSPLAATGNNLFSKALIKDGNGIAQNVTINPGETLTVRYQLSIAIYDAVKRATGLPGQNGNLKIQKVGLKGISDITGQTIDFDDTAGCNEPALQANIFVSANSAAPDMFNSCVDRSPGPTKLGSLSTYVSGSYGRKKGVIFKPSELIPTFRSVGVGSPASHGAVFVFDADQTSEANKAYLANFSYFWVHQSPSSFSDWLSGEDYLYLNKRSNKVNTYAYFAL